jgi:hypothetical protein
LVDGKVIGGELAVRCVKVGEELEYRMTRKVPGWVAELVEVERWYGLKELAFQMETDVGVDGEFMLVGKELTVDFGDDWGGGCRRMVWSSSRMHRRIERDVAGFEKESGGGHGYGQMAKSAIASNGGDGFGVGLKFRMQELQGNEGRSRVGGKSGEFRMWERVRFGFRHVWAKK